MKSIRDFWFLAVLFALILGSVSLSPAQTYQGILNSDKEPQNWLTYGGGYSSHRFSELKQINRSNIADLKPLWIYQRSEMAGEFIETSPVVVDGVMYITEPPSTVTALDAATGVKLWSWSPVLPKVVNFFGGHANNRGVAVLDGTVYEGTLDAHLVALDGKTGAVRWIKDVAPNADNHWIAGVPLAIDGKILIGTGGGDRAARGLLAAYDAKTGELLWHLWTVPGANEPGSETWGGGPIGGGDIWGSGSYDPALNLVYYGTGNPSPSYDGGGRPGDNLYTCSLLAIDADTGKIKWYFQFTPHDVHDYDSTQTPILFDATIGGKPRKLVAVANRNSFYYILDRTTGEFLSGTPFAKQTWTKGLDAKGRPIPSPELEPSPQGTLTYPSLSGAVNWVPPSYDPENGLLYVNAKEIPGLFTLTGSSVLSGDDTYAAIRALEASTGKLKWEYKLTAGGWVSPLATAGGLVFCSDDAGQFFALDADTGKYLWRFPTGGFDPRDNPVTYSVDGKQYVVMPSANIFIAFGLP